MTYKQQANNFTINFQNQKNNSFKFLSQKHTHITTKGTVILSLCSAQWRIEKFKIYGIVFFLY